MVGQLLTSYTNDGGNVYSKDGSIYATNAMWAQYASLKDGRDDPSRVSWASFERLTNQGDNKNATFVLHIEEPKVPGGASGSSVAVASKTGSPTASGTGSSATTGAQSLTTTAASTSGAGLGHGSQVAHVVGLAVVAAGWGAGIL
jgi:hypothetical protein